ncbi:hypothetical protein C8R44DRAFT_742246 [Mycena epipterygia]|nr:hypothetical protein C8R44DRAFT_742246 [Mycena epipterygia]
MLVLHGPVLEGDPLQVARIMQLFGLAKFDSVKTVSNLIPSHFASSFSSCVPPHNHVAAIVSKIQVPGYTQCFTTLCMCTTPLENSNMSWCYADVLPTVSLVNKGCFWFKTPYNQTSTCPKYKIHRKLSTGGPKHNSMRLVYTAATPPTRTNFNGTKYFFHIISRGYYIDLHSRHTDKLKYAHITKMSPSFNYRNIKQIIHSSMEAIAQCTQNSDSGVTPIKTCQMLDMETRSPAETVYPKLGYIQLGIIPNYGVSPVDGSLIAGTFFWKQL